LSWSEIHTAKDARSIRRSIRKSDLYGL